MHSTTAGKDVMESKKKRLPYATLHAKHLAESMTGLQPRAQSALAAIVLFVNCRYPLKEVFAHRTSLAERAGISERTWYRAEAELVEKGFIRIAEQKRKKRQPGLFGSAYIYLTENGARALDLIGTAVTRKDHQAVDKSTRRNAADTRRSVPAYLGQKTGGETLGANHAAFAPPSATASDAYTNDVYQFPFIQKRQQGALPADLERLQSLGFGKFFIFKLMKEARLAGKWLSDVVEVTWEHLKVAKSPRRYLLALLKSQTDFISQLRMRKDAVVADEMRRNREQEVQHAVKRVAGQTFYVASAKTRFTVSRDALELTVLHACELKPRTSTYGWASEFLAGIAANRIMPATTSLEREFHQVRSGYLTPSDARDPNTSVSLNQMAEMRAALKEDAVLKESR